MRKTSAQILAALGMFALAAPASSQQLALASGPCPVMPSSQPTPQAAVVQPDVIAVFANGLPEGTRVTVGLMDNQKLKGVLLGVRDGRLLLRADRDRSGTLRISFWAIHSIKVREGGAIERP